ncbi:hypothetical protein OUZ56_028016 [Daphnia magna]|uniref:Uncharacterized protein n=1 Tax=Daphnia magna TaxID=35525 RepID=A0ABR0B2L3_9CRUS|nr:hypothetical protein OUZ56_028016 [Daphnia magna]
MPTRAPAPPTRFSPPWTHGDSGGGWRSVPGVIARCGKCTKPNHCHRRLPIGRSPEVCLS